MGRPYRVLLPLCNLAIDVALLVAAVQAVDLARSNIKVPWPLWHQQYQRVDRDFLRHADGPPMVAPLQAMNYGTLPAKIGTDLFAEVSFANGALSWKVSSPFDARLVAIHLAIAFGFWHVLGRWLEEGRRSWMRLAWSWVAVRAFTVPLSLICRPTDAIWQLLALSFLAAWGAWLALVLAAGMRNLWIRRKSLTGVGDR